MKLTVSLACSLMLIYGTAGSTLDEKVNAKIIPKAPWCGTQATEKIYGGEEAGLTEFPWLALINYSEPNKTAVYRCHGSLINDRYVVTGAICVTNVRLSAGPQSVRLGEHDLSTEKDCEADDNTECALKVVDVEIEEAIVHPKFKKGKLNPHNDIALLRLKRKVTFTDYVSPICLPLDPTFKNKDYTGHSFQVAGWGKTESSDHSNIKLKVDLKFFPECAEAYNRTGRVIVDSQICAGGEVGKDTCRGDSGAPLMATAVNDQGISYYYAVGLTSFGSSLCAAGDFPGAYTRISSFIDWIAENVHE